MRYGLPYLVGRMLDSGVARLCHARMGKAAPRRIGLLTVGVLVAVTACSGGGSTPPAVPSSHSTATLAPGTVTTGRPCRALHFRLEPQAVAQRQARAKLAQMSLPQEISLMHGAGLNSGPAGAVGS